MPRPAPAVPLACATLLALALGGCGAPPEPPPSQPARHTIPVAGRPLRLTYGEPEEFEWPGALVVSTPTPGRVVIVNSYDNPCRITPYDATGALRGDTIAVIVRGTAEADEPRICPGAITPFSYRVEMDGIPAGAFTLAIYRSRGESRTAELTHAEPVTVR